MKKGISPTAIIALGFLCAIIIGTALLMLPVCQSGEVEIELIDALFTATSSVCVTGLLTIPNYIAWSDVGQAIILILIEIGGLGIITFTTIFLIVLGRRIGIRDRVIIQNAYNLDSPKGVVLMAKRILKGTIIVEGIGALIYMIEFVPRFGTRGIWISIFNSISAFCNAGMDIIGPNSLEDYACNTLVMITTMILIILGGIGFPIWWYYIDEVKDCVKKEKSFAGFKRRQPLYVKMVVRMSIILIVIGMIVTFVFEYNNHDTIADMNLYQKLLTSLFQSVTWRTAGFATISQSSLRVPTILCGCVLMFIGGSPSGTAGGIKTTTVLIILATVVSILREKNDTEIFHRKINGNIVRRAIAIFMVSLNVLIVSLFFMGAFAEGIFVDVLYEVVSALGTVGLSRDFTPLLDTAGKTIIICTMFIGRIGPISLAMFFNTKQYRNNITYAEEKVSVG